MTRNTQNLQPFKRGADSRRNISGRPKKFATLLRADGYSASEINSTIAVLLSLTRAELAKVKKHPQATAFEVLVATAIEQSIKKGDLKCFEPLVSRAYGKPQQSIMVEHTDNSEELINKLLTVCVNLDSLQLFEVSILSEPNDGLASIYTPEIFEAARARMIEMQSLIQSDN